MDEEELENLIVRITGDASGYEDMLEEASEKGEEAADNIEKSASRIERLGESVKGFFKSAIEAVTGIGAKNELEDFLDAFAEAEEVDIQVSAALRANKRDVESLMKSYAEFATEIEHQTTLSDESVKLLLKQAETFGLTGKAAERAAKDAIALSSITGGSAQAMIRLTAALSRGDIDTAKRFARLVPQLRGIKDNAEFVKKATDLMNAGWEVATEKAGTAHGMLKQLDEMIGDIKEELGKTVSDVIKPFIESLKDIAKWVAALPEPTKQAVVVALALTVAIGLVTAAITAATAAATLFDISTGGMLLILGAIVTGIAIATGAIVSFASATGGFAALATKARDALQEFWQWLKPIRQALVSLGRAVEEIFNDIVESVKQSIIELWQSINEGADWNKIRDDIVRAILSAEFYLRNFKRTWDIVWFGAKVGLIIFKNDMIHFFMVQVPIFVRNMGIGFKNLFSNMVDNFQISVKNMVDNFVNIMKFLPAMLKGKITFNEVWKPLSDGFKLNISEGMKEIPSRVISPTERMMLKLFGEMWANLDADRKKFIEQKLKEFGLTPEVEKAAEDAGETTGEEFNKGLDKEIKKVDAAIFGSAEALSRIADFRERNARRITDTAPKKEEGFGKKMFDAIARQKQVEEIKTKDPEALQVLKRIAENTKSIPSNDFQGFLIPSSLT